MVDLGASKMHRERDEVDIIMQLVRDLESTSAKIIKMEGNKGSPCLKPCDEEKNQFLDPLIKTKYQTLEIPPHHINPNIRETKSFENFNKKRS